VTAPTGAGCGLSCRLEIEWRFATRVAATHGAANRVSAACLARADQVMVDNASKYT